MSWGGMNWLKMLGKDCIACDGVGKCRITVFLAYFSFLSFFFGFVKKFDF
jgi:hypothetical protein